VSTLKIFLKHLGAVLINHSEKSRITIAGIVRNDQTLRVWSAPP
jgi:hypothetical protein